MQVVLLEENKKSDSACDKADVWIGWEKFQRYDVEQAKDQRCDDKETFALKIQFMDFGNEKHQEIF
jgi:hypothetical protein